MTAKRKKIRILLLEDESILRKGIRINLEAEGYEVVEFDRADRAWESFSGEPALFSLAVLDIMTPGRMNGLELCENIRRIRGDIPVIFLTAKNRLGDKLAGFDAGGDDYLTKPFDLEELLARIRARLRKPVAKRADHVGRFEISIETATIRSEQSGETIRLNERENAILKLLLDHRGKPVSRDRILDEVWGANEFPTNRTIDNFIVKFRKIFEDDPKNPRYFITRHGTGYELADE
jgi:two-component system alkaline phosphatase synthesis response regulator PhoP